MRYLPLLMMTGIGFTLGILCSLLLQLPAHNLPHATDIHHLSITGDLHDRSFRSRRSFSEGVDGSSTEEEGQLQGSSRVSRLHRGGSVSGGMFSLQSQPEPEIGSNPFVSSSGANKAEDSQHRGTGDLNGHGSNGAEPSGQSVKNDVQATNTKGGYSAENPTPVPPSPPLATNRPVTSFTLRLKNAGGKFVVDSAVKRAEEDSSVYDTESAGHVDLDVQVPPHKEEDTPFLPPLSKTWSLSDIVNGVLWSKTLENSCPKDFQPKEVASWRRRVMKMVVVKVEEGCGRMQNRLLTFKDGSQACARYRFNTDQIQGEVYSYYLAQLLNITHLPPAVMLPVDTSSPQWRSVHLELSMAQWTDGRLVVLTRWLDHLTPAYIPHELREDERKLHPTEEILGKKSLPELCDLLQWSDLIVFDYLTANLDRLVNNMFNKQWNAEMMNNPAHNLERAKSGSLVFLDNESGLFHGYRLLEKYHSYHESLLNSLCVFRDSTAKAVKALHRGGRVGEELHKLFTEQEQHHGLLAYMPEKNASVLKDRLAKVHDQIVRCEAVYGR